MKMVERVDCEGGGEVGDKCVGQSGVEEDNEWTMNGQMESFRFTFVSKIILK